MTDETARNGGAGPAEHALIRRAKGGDAQALDALLRTVEPRVRRWARSWLDSPDDADDVAQATLLAAARGIRAFDGRSRLETWLHRIARRCAADCHRRRRRVRRLADRQRGRPAEPVPPYEPETIDHDRALRAVRDAYRALPARQREIFDLVELQGRSVEAVAELLGVARPTVRVHLLRARRTLRGWLLERHSVLVEDRHDMR